MTHPTPPPDRPPLPEPAAWLWEYIGTDPYPHALGLVARTRREMDPDNPEYPNHWRAVAPLYTARALAAWLLPEEPEPEPGYRYEQRHIIWQRDNRLRALLLAEAQRAESGT